MNQSTAIRAIVGGAVLGGGAMAVVSMVDPHTDRKAKDGSTPSIPHDVLIGANCGAFAVASSLGIGRNLTTVKWPLIGIASGAVVGAALTTPWDGDIDGRKTAINSLVLGMIGPVAGGALGAGIHLGRYALNVHTSFTAVKRTIDSIPDLAPELQPQLDALRMWIAKPVGKGDLAVLSQKKSEAEFLQLMSAG